MTQLTVTSGIHGRLCMINAHACDNERLGNIVYELSRVDILWSLDLYKQLVLWMICDRFLDYIGVIQSIFTGSPLKYSGDEFN